MTPRVASGFELLSLPTSTTVGTADGYAGGTTPATIDQFLARSGQASAKCAGGTTATSWVGVPLASTSGGRRYAACWVYLDAYPVANAIVARYYTSGTAQAALRLTPGGMLQLLNQAGTQIGSTSADTVPLNTWTRLSLSQKNGVGATDVMEGGIGETVFATTATDGSISADASELRVGWLDAPGQTANLWVDDVIVNDAATGWGNAETSYPATPARVALLWPNRLVARGTWTTDKNTTSDADVLLGLNQRPPAGVADSTSNTSVHQVRSASNATSPADAVEVETISLGRAGIPGPLFNETTGGTYQALGDAAARTRVAQGFYIATGVTRVELSIRRQGTPTDDLTVDVQTDSAGVPSGTSVGSATIPAASVAGAVAWVVVDLVVPTTPRSKYWLVLARGGAADASNYYELQKGASNSYYDGGVALHNGTSWGAATPADALMIRVYNDVGMAQVRLVFPQAYTGEAIATGTKSGQVQLTSPVGSAASMTYGGDVGAAGAYPTNWAAWGIAGILANPGFASARDAVQLSAAKYDGTTRVALLCGLHATVEYTDPAGWVGLTKTADATLWWAKPCGTTTTGYYSAAGVETAVPCRAGDWFLTSDPLPAEGVALTNLTTTTDADIKANYTPA